MGSPHLHPPKLPRKRPSIYAEWARAWAEGFVCIAVALVVSFGIFSLIKALTSIQ